MENGNVDAESAFSLAILTWLLSATQDVWQIKFGTENSVNGKLKCFFNTELRAALLLMFMKCF